MTIVNSPHCWSTIRQRKSLTQVWLSPLGSKRGSNKMRKKTAQRPITFLTWLMTTKSSQFHPFLARRIKMRLRSLNIKSWILTSEQWSTSVENSSMAMELLMRLSGRSKHFQARGTLEALPRERHPRCRQLGQEDSRLGEHLQLMMPTQGRRRNGLNSSIWEINRPRLKSSSQQVWCHSSSWKRLRPFCSLNRPIMS